jgi:hypothetical protein
LIRANLLDPHLVRAIVSLSPRRVMRAVDGIIAGAFAFLLPLLAYAIRSMWNLLNGDAAGLITGPDGLAFIEVIFTSRW